MIRYTDCSCFSTPHLGRASGCFRAPFSSVGRTTFAFHSFPFDLRQSRRALLRLRRRLDPWRGWDVLRLLGWPQTVPPANHLPFEPAFLVGSPVEVSDRRRHGSLCISHEAKDVTDVNGVADGAHHRVRDGGGCEGSGVASFPRVRVGRREGTCVGSEDGVCGSSSPLGEVPRWCRSP